MIRTPGHVVPQEQSSGLHDSRVVQAPLAQWYVAVSAAPIWFSYKCIWFLVLSLVMLIQFQKAGLYPGFHSPE